MLRREVAVRVHCRGKRAGPCGSTSRSPEGSSESQRGTTYRRIAEPHLARRYAEESSDQRVRSPLSAITVGEALSPTVQTVAPGTGIGDDQLRWVHLPRPFLLRRSRSSSRSLSKRSSVDCRDAATSCSHPSRSCKRRHEMTASPPRDADTGPPSGQPAPVPSPTS